MILKNINNIIFVQKKKFEEIIPQRNGIIYFYSLFYIFIKKGGIAMIQLSWTTIKEVQIIDELIKDNLLRDGDYFITVKNSGFSTYYDKLKFAEQLKELVTDKLNRYVLSKKRNEFRWAINLTDRKTISENSFVERYKVYFEYPDDSGNYSGYYECCDSEIHAIL